MREENLLGLNLKQSWSDKSETSGCPWLLQRPSLQTPGHATRPTGEQTGTGWKDVLLSNKGARPPTRTRS